MPFYGQCLHQEIKTCTTHYANGQFFSPVNLPQDELPWKKTTEANNNPKIYTHMTT